MRKNCLIFMFMLCLIFSLQAQAVDLNGLEDGIYQIEVKDGEVIRIEEEMSEETSQAEVGSGVAQAMDINLADGEYAIELNMSGGSGKASIVSPTLLTVKDGKAYAHLTWSSSHYDYMIVDGEKFLNQSEPKMNSAYDIPIQWMDEEMSVIADTTAMGTPHEVNYSITFFSESIGSKSALPQEAAKRVVLIALLIIIGGGILNYYVNKKNAV